MDLKELVNNINEISSEKIEFLKKTVTSFPKIIILGNGGSNAISSHISQDYTKKLGIKSMSFSDSSRLTCYINDYGMDLAYSKYIEHFFDQNTLVILISSSGKSPNILNAADFCKKNKIKMITLSGFEINNPLKTKFSKYSEIDFWVNSFDYGIVECTHQIILHSII